MYLYPVPYLKPQIPLLFGGVGSVRPDTAGGPAQGLTTGTNTSKILLHLGEGYVPIVGVGGVGVCVRVLGGGVGVGCEGVIVGCVGGVGVCRFWDRHVDVVVPVEESQVGL